MKKNASSMRRSSRPPASAACPQSNLHRTRRDMTVASWEAVYQQNPIIVGGGDIPIEKLRVHQLVSKFGCIIMRKA